MKKEKKLCSCGLYAEYNYYENKKVKRSYSFKGMWRCKCGKVYFDSETIVYKEKEVEQPKLFKEDFITQCRKSNMTNEDFKTILELINKYNLKL